MPNYKEDNDSSRNNQNSMLLDDIAKKIAELELYLENFKGVEAQLVDGYSTGNDRKSKVLDDVAKKIEKLEEDVEFFKALSTELVEKKIYSPKPTNSSHLKDQQESFNKAVTNRLRAIVDSDDEFNESTSDGGESFVTDDSEGDDDARSSYFPCPFCYVDIEVHVLCSHLQEEHCFDLKNAVCPLCAANLGKDAIGHFIVQHASSLKRRRKYPKSGFSTSNSAMLGKELSSFLGSSTNVRGSGQESAPDPLLSPFLCSATQSGTKGIRQDECSNNNASVTDGLKSSILSPLDEGHEQDNEERRLKAAFVRGLIESAIFLDIDASS